MKLVRVRDQTGRDWLTYYGQVWNKQLVFICVRMHVTVCVHFSVQRYQRKQMQSKISSGVSHSSVSRAGYKIAENCCNKLVQDIHKKCVMLHSRGGVMHVMCDLWFVKSECLPFCSFLELAQVKFKLSQNENPFCTNVKQFQWNKSIFFSTAQQLTFPWGLKGKQCWQKGETMH